MEFSVRALLLGILVCTLFVRDSAHERSSSLFAVTASNSTTTFHFLELFVGEDTTLTFNITQSLSDPVKVRSSDNFVFKITGFDDPDNIEVNVGEPFELTISGEFLGIEKIEFIDPDTQNIIGSYGVKVKRVPGLINLLFTVVLLIWLVISYVSMGALITWDELKLRLFPPWRLLIGMISQFFVMPVITFLLASTLPVDATTAIGIVLVGTCPGGWLSNIFSVLLDVDFILSVTMTFFSSIIALFMMPLNIWIYASPFIGDDSSLSTPFFDLILQLVILVVSCGAGVLLGWKFKTFRKFCDKVLKPIAVLLIISGLALGIPADFHMFFSPWQLWVAAITTPLIGAYMGLSLTRIFGINIKSSVTVSLETGVQNALLARTVVYLAYPQPEGDLIGRVQTLTVLITLIEGVVICVVHMLVQYVFCKGRRQEDEEELQNGEARTQRDFSANDKKRNESNTASSLDKKNEPKEVSSSEPTKNFFNAKAGNGIENNAYDNEVLSSDNIDLHEPKTESKTSVELGIHEESSSTEANVGIQNKAYDDGASWA